MNRNYTSKLIFSFLIIFNLNNFLSAEKYRISHENYSVNGISKADYISHKIKINHKKEFQSKEELESYISELTQKYTNLRLFDDIKIEPMYSSEKNNETTSVFLEIHLIDSKNVILVPYYKYNEKHGHVITAVFRDSNFLGTLEPLQTELFFEMKNKKDSEGLNYTLGTTFTYNVPFFLGKIETSFINDYMLKYTFGSDLPEYNAKAGLSFSLPVNDIIKPELNLFQKAVHDLDYKIYNDQMYFSEIAEFKVPFIITSAEYTGDIIYTPSVNYIFNWKPDSKISLRDDELLSPELLFSNEIGFEKINWNGNFRKGLYLNIRQDTGYNFLINKMVIGGEAEFRSYFSNDYAGFFLRMYGFVYENKHKTIDYRLRGIVNDKYFNRTTSLNDINGTSSQCALVLNLDFPIKIWTTDFEKMKMPVFKKLNFELQVVPFIDIALTKNRVTQRVFDLCDGFYTAGIEFIAFPLSFKSLCVRASAGFDLGRTLLKDIIDTSWRPDISIYEISIGIGLFY
ncbi:MAG: hypothetical protein KBT21_11135 [Treponema sp.]|nr:hypothetical protein [Candidatus Treponema merdequi]